MIAILAYFNPEEATRGVLQEKMFLEISQNSQENTCEFCEISKNTFSQRTPLMADSASIKENLLLYMIY